MKVTRYFEEQVLRKRHYIKWEWCEKAINAPDYKMVQIDGRVRYYKYIDEIGKFLRVVTLDDGITVHNAFPDRDFKPELQA